MAGVTALAQWYGSNRQLGPKVGAALKGLEWVGIPFCGGMCEVPHIEARTINVNDKHRHVINLAWMLADSVLGPQVYRQLRRLPFHPGVLRVAQDTASSWELEEKVTDEERVEWALNYFISAWMTRSTSAGTPAEFTGNLSIRWEAGGGDSAKRYQSAVRAINSWRRTLRSCNFTCLDFREFLGKCKDLPGHGIYADAPWPDDGKKYTHKFTEQDQRDLAESLTSYKQARVVVRFGEHPLIRELYPEPLWTWHPLTSRTQTNKPKAEFLIIRNGK